MSQMSPTPPPVTKRPAFKEPDFKRPSLEELKKSLSPIQYKVTQEDGTEKPFDNLYWDQKSDGIYVDLISGEPLFSSLDKFDSGTGWPSFSKSILDEHGSSAIEVKTDTKFLMKRTEVRSKAGDSHLGHVFDDGPAPTGKRFCMNSASLKFIPLEELQKSGYGPLLFDFAAHKKWETATLAGGCFWGVENLLRKLEGVIETRVGYSGGNLNEATYEQVKTGITGHAEAVQILFDPSRLTYERILLNFFRLHDPTTKNQQGNDVGTQYRSAIFFHSESQKFSAEKVKKQIELSGKWKKPLVTEVVPFGKLWTAEDYHQKYLVKHADGYNCHYYREFKFD